MYTYYRCDKSYTANNMYVFLSLYKELDRNYGRW